MYARTVLPLAFLLGLVTLDSSTAPPATPTPRSSSPHAWAKRSLQGAPAPAPRAQAKQSRRAFEPLTESVVIHGRRRDEVLWTDRSLVVELAPSAASTAALRARFPDAVEESTSVATMRPTMRIWRCPRSSDGSSPAARLRQLHPDAAIAEVFRASSDPDSAIRILPGGVFVYLAEGIDAATGAAALRSAGFRVVEQLPIAAPAFLVASGPGADALDVVERVQSLDAIACAMPVSTLQVARQ